MKTLILLGSIILVLFSGCIFSPDVDLGTMNGLVPTDGSSTTDTTPTFSWNSVEGAVGYELQIADSEAGVETAPTTSVTGTSYTPSTALTNLQTHYWRVRAKDGDGQYGAWSAINSLSVNWGAVSGLIPANGSDTTDTTPALSWSETSGAVGYQIRMADNESGLENAVSVEEEGEIHHPTTAWDNSHVHYWQVRAKDADGQYGPWSAIHSLEVSWGAVSGLSPANGSATTDTIPTFSWNAVEGAAGYELQIAGSRAGVETAPATIVTGTSYTPTSALTNEQTHYWRVRAKDGAGQYGAWSGVQSLGVFMLETVYVEGGSFQMGSTDSDADSDESPVHEVTVRSFSMAKTEVTQGQWKAVMGDENNPSKWKGDSLPVESVTWYDAVAYCNALSAKEGLEKVYTINGTTVTADFDKNGWRLPTEAEWEYASRGGKESKGYKYSGSDTVGDVGWNRDNSGLRTHPVGEKAANELGLYDMSGNVSEWCWDWYGDYSSVSQTDPTGLSSGSSRVLRGGSWFYYGRYLRSANRDFYTPSYSYDDLGFRPVRRT